MGHETPKILVVDDDLDVLTAMRLLLKSKAKNVIVEKNPGNIVSLIKQHKFDVIILDMNFNGLINTGNEGISNWTITKSLRISCTSSPSVPFGIFTAIVVSRI